jgi:cytosine/adenosine deaminase-related metal-dependent hydrolase
MRSYKADWVIPVSSNPINGGIVDIEGGLIKKVHQEDCPCQEYIGGTILPGFINAHTHLELSGLKGKIKSHQKGIADWLHAFNDIFPQVGYKEDSILDSIIGLKDYGVIAVGDISSSGLSIKLD